MIRFVRRWKVQTRSLTGGERACGSWFAEFRTPVPLSCGSSGRETSASASAGPYGRRLASASGALVNGSVRATTASPDHVK